MASKQPLRDLYARYLTGAVSFEDVKAATDSAVAAFEASQGRRPETGASAPESPR